MTFLKLKVSLRLLYTYSFTLLLVTHKKWTILVFLNQILLHNIISIGLGGGGRSDHEVSSLEVLSPCHMTFSDGSNENLHKTRKFT